MMTAWAASLVPPLEAGGDGRLKPLPIDELTEKVAGLRRLLVELTCKTGGSYLAQALSSIDMLSALFYRKLRFRPGEPDWPDRDRFLLSPGHYALGLYVVLADLGYFPRDWLMSFKDDGSPVELCTHRGTLPGVEVSGGSLGQVLSVGVGMALHAKLRHKPHGVFVLMSDGEQDEGQIWEAAASAAHFGLSNLRALIDKNGYQVDGPTAEVMDMEPLGDKYRAFGWQVMEIDGNDLDAVVSALDRIDPGPGRPTVIIGNTTRGKGLSFMEGRSEFHYSRLDGDLGDRARQELLRGGTDAA